MFNANTSRTSGLKLELLLCTPLLTIQPYDQVLRSTFQVQIALQGHAAILDYHKKCDRLKTVYTKTGKDDLQIKPSFLV